MGTPKEYEVLAVVDELPDVCAYRLATLVTLLPAENIPAEDNSFYLCALMVDAGDLKGTEEKSGNMFRKETTDCTMFPTG